MADEERYIDPVVRAYMADVDRTLPRENLKKTPEERIRALQALQRAAEELAEAGRPRCQCIDLETLIRAKRATGRPKDLEVIAELESLRADSL